MPLKIEESSQKKRVTGRPSLTSIPTVDLSTLLNPKKKVPEKTEIVVNESEILRNELCNSYKFVANYGVFEQNFEWLPMEVNSSGDSLKVFFWNWNHTKAIADN